MAMTAEAFRRMQLAAKELLRLQARGHDVDPLSCEWARSISKQVWNAPPPQKAYRQDRIYEAMQAHGSMGMLASEIAERSGLTPRMCAQALCYMVQHEQLYMVKVQSRSRYFLTAALMVAGRALIEAEEEARKAAKKVRRRRRLPAEPKSVKAKPVKHARPKVAAPRRAARKAAMLINPRDQGVLTADMLPANVRIEVLPGPRDRFEVVPPVRGIGAMADWKKRLRARVKAKG